MSGSLNVWVVDDDAAIRWVLERALSAAGHQPRGFEAAEPMLQRLDTETPDVLVTDVRMPGLSGLELLRRVQNARPDLPVIIITAHSDLDSAVAAYRGGAFEYLPKPFDVDDVVDLVQRAAARNRGAAERPAKSSEAPDLIGEAPAMQDVFRAIGRLSQSRINVLITGESGTGKELVARALHEHSPRAPRPFIAVNTAAIPKDLMESEFFGHERGAFTGAQASRRGRFEQANGGTLFLDEIGEMSPDLQTRLLRVLNDGQFYRVGGVDPMQVDVRVIAATNQDLEAAVHTGAFREDLFHRLNVIRIRVPPLRERREDAPLLLDYFLARAARELGTERKVLTRTAATVLSNHDWPGNVRQLENTCRWLTVMAPGREVHRNDLPPELNQHVTSITAPGHTDWETALQIWAEQRLNQGATNLMDEATPAVERILIQTALIRSNGHRQKAARLLGLGRNTLTRKLKELDIASNDSAS